MGVLDELALDGAEQVERRLGKRAALRTLSPLLESMRPGRARARVHLRVMALSAGTDPRQHELLLAAWEIERHGRHRDLKRTVRALIGEGLTGPAAAIAQAEVARVLGEYEEASARYVHGRALEAGDDRAAALAAYDRAVEAADEQPRLRQVAAVRAIRVCQSVDDVAARAAPLLPLEEGGRSERLTVAVAALACPGRYRRVAALDVLAQLASGDDIIARVALARTARHAEDARLSTIEADRVRTALSRRGHDEAVRRLDGRLGFDANDASGAHTDPEAAAMTLRARAVLEGCAPGPRPAGGRALIAWIALAIVHAAREGRVNEVREHLREAAERASSGERIEAALWSAAHASLELAPEAARALVRALASRHGGEPPPHGYLPLADALLAIAAEEEGVALLRRAARGREPEARVRLADHLRHAGWRAADEGRRDEAISLLTEAKRLAG